MSGKKKSFWDVRSPALRPLWLRVLIVAACTGWALFELSNGAVFWAILFGAAAAHLFWQLLVDFDVEDDA